MKKGGVVYILTNQRHTVLYVGLTSHLFCRIIEHREGKYPNSFTKRYNVNKLVYFEPFHDIEEAINREKQIKKYRREKKEELINKRNPNWIDLFDEIKEW